jgi:hypothetical protein
MNESAALEVYAALGRSVDVPAGVGWRVALIGFRTSMVETEESLESTWVVRISGVGLAMTSRSCSAGCIPSPHRAARSLATPRSTHCSLAGVSHAQYNP